MLLTIDIGNSNITIGVFNETELLLSARLGTRKDKTGDEYASDLSNIFMLNSLESNNFEGSIISSVVPELTSAMFNAVEAIIGQSPLVVGPGIKTGLEIITDNQALVGADLVSVSVGAISKYPLPCFIVDLGTATKILLINEKGAFCGCSISAGVKISLNALSEKTSQLPAIRIKTPDTAIGTSTVDCMLSGTVLGTAAMIDGLIERMEVEFGQTVDTIIGTGGHSEVIIKSCNRKIIYDPYLILDGLRIIWNKNQRKRKK